MEIYLIDQRNELNCEQIIATVSAVFGQNESKSGHQRGLISLNEICWPDLGAWAASFEDNRLVARLAGLSTLQHMLHIWSCCRRGFGYVRIARDAANSFWARSKVENHVFLGAQFCLLYCQTFAVVAAACRNGNKT